MSSCYLPPPHTSSPGVPPPPHIFFSYLDMYFLLEALPTCGTFPGFNSSVRHHVTIPVQKENKAICFKKPLNSVKLAEFTFCIYMITTGLLLICFLLHFVCFSNLILLSFV